MLLVRFPRISVPTIVARRVATKQSHGYLETKKPRVLRRGDAVFHPQSVSNPKTPLHGGKTNRTACGQVFWLPDQPPAASSHPSRDSDFERPLSPVTAAGPRRTCTVFPIAPKGQPAGMALPIVQCADGVKENMPISLEDRSPARQITPTLQRGRWGQAEAY